MDAIDKSVEPPENVDAPARHHGASKPLL